MLTEHFIASILRPESVASHVPHKDAGIYFHELQPLPDVRSILKKSSTLPNCLAATSTHVFAAQADKAALHVYSVERGAQECVVPFPEKITSVALVGGRASNGILAMGSESGRITLWELGTGRQVSPAAAHLQKVTCLAVDPTNNFLLSGSADSTIYVWGLAALLSFTRGGGRLANHDQAAPAHTLSGHRGAVTCVAAGHSYYSAAVAVSVAEDKSCLVWAYRTGALLHTFLLAAPPLCVALDPADRACYVGHSDGTVQLVDFFRRGSSENPLFQKDPMSAVSEPQRTVRWAAAAVGASPVQAIALSYDGTKVLTGHETGKVFSWDVGRASIQGDAIATLLGPVTNLLMIPVAGLARGPAEGTSLSTVIKPKHVSLLKAKDDSVSSLPEKYVLHARFEGAVSLVPEHRFRDERLGGPDPLTDDFLASVLEIGLPDHMLDEDIAALQEQHTPDGARPRRPRLSAADGGEAEELHAMLAQATQESLALKDRVDQLGKELVRMRQAERERLRARRLKQSRCARRDQLRRQQYMAGGHAAGPLDAPEGDQLDAGSSQSDDLSISQ